MDYVVGVATHRDEHVLAVVGSPSGGVPAQQSVRASARGYAEAVRFVEQCTGGRRVWTVVGAGHYGAGLVRHLSDQGETVLEIGAAAAVTSSGCVARMTRWTRSERHERRSRAGR
jgi:hypothetical protein